MGFLDTIKSIFGTPPAAPEQQMRGPLHLAPGDAVGYYRERFAVTGLRVLEGEGSTVYQYILRDAKGQRIVLNAEDGPEPTYTLQRVVTGQVDWNADVLTGLGEEPFKLTQRGQMRVRSFGDPLTMASRQCTYREYEDPTGEQVVTLEDFGNYKEVRVGEPVFEPEMQFARAGEAAVAAVEPEDAEVAVTTQPGADRRRGSPIAAAMALSGRNVGDAVPLRADASKAKTHDEAGDDVDPTAYDDEKWSDEDGSDAPKSATAAPGVEDFVDSEEDEWAVATQYVREQGDKK